MACGVWLWACHFPIQRRKNMVTITGLVKYARHMQGKTAKGEDYSFFSFVVLDTDEGIRWPLQLQNDHPQFAEMCQSEKQLMDQPVSVVIRSFSAGMQIGRAHV